MLDFTDKALNQMSFPIAPFVIFARFFSVFLRRYHRFRTAGSDGVQEILRTITTISQHKVKIQINDQISGHDDVMALACGQFQPQRIPQTINCHVDFAAEATATAPQGLFGLSTVFFRAPAAQAWARTTVLSIMPFSISGSSAK